MYKNDWKVLSGSLVFIVLLELVTTLMKTVLQCQEMIEESKSEDQMKPINEQVERIIIQDALKSIENLDKEVESSNDN